MVSTGKHEKKRISITSASKAIVEGVELELTPSTVGVANVGLPSSDDPDFGTSIMSILDSVLDEEEKSVDTQESRRVKGNKSRHKRVKSAGVTVGIFSMFNDKTRERAQTDDDAAASALKRTQLGSTGTIFSQLSSFFKKNKDAESVPITDSNSDEKTSSPMSTGSPLSLSPRLGDMSWSPSTIVHKSIASLPEAETMTVENPGNDGHSGKAHTLSPHGSSQSADLTHSSSIPRSGNTSKLKEWFASLGTK